jgi:hypothetical protein
VYDDFFAPKKLAKRAVDVPVGGQKRKGIVLDVKHGQPQGTVEIYRSSRRSL